MSSLLVDWLRSSHRALTLRQAPISARLRLLSLGVSTRLGPRRDRVWRYGPGRVEWPGETVDTDWRVFAEIFLHRVYAAEYSAAVVVDAGAHKGYFGAYALLSGAAAVLSVEPASQNFRFLERAAGSFQADEQRWMVHQAAVGRRDGQAELQLQDQPWAHTVLPTGTTVGRRVSVERVAVMSMRGVLELARSLGPGRLIVKLDVEGAECDAVCGTPSADWEAVGELFVEHHDFAPCSAEDLRRHLADAGLALQETRIGDVLVFRR